MSEGVYGKHQSPTEKMSTSGCDLGGLTDMCKLPSNNKALHLAIGFDLWNPLVTPSPFLIYYRNKVIRKIPIWDIIW